MVPFNVLRWAQLLKDYSDSGLSETQADALKVSGWDRLPYLLGKNGHLHPEWDTGRTGRRHTRHPNIQGITKALRPAISAPGKLILWVDWKASHMQLLARLSQDEEMRGDLAADPYSVVGLAYDRKVTKRVVLAVINGAGADGVDGVDPEVVQAISAEMGARWPTASRYLFGRIQEARTTGAVMLPSGYSLPVPEPYKAPAYLLQCIEAQALAWVLEQPRPEGLDLVLPLHDETVWSCGPDQLEAAEAWVIETMAKAMGVTSADVVAKHGPAWGEEGEEPAEDRPVSLEGVLGQARERVEAFYLNPQQVMQDPSTALLIGLLAFCDPDSFKEEQLNAALKHSPKLAAKRWLAERGLGGVRKGGEARAAASDIEPLEDGSHATVAKAYVQYLAPDGHIKAVPDGVRVYKKETGLWDLLTKADIAAGLLRFKNAPYHTKQGIAALRINGPDQLGMTSLVSSTALAVGGANWQAKEVGYMAFDGGLTIDSAGKELLKDPENKILSEHQLPFKYDPAATCPRWEQALTEWFQGGTDIKAKIALVQELVGAALFGEAVKWQKHAILYGHKANNGKSVFLDVLGDLFPAGTIAASSPHTWAESFGKAGLYRKRANLISELPDNDIVGSASVKAVLTGDLCEINRKYQQPFEYRPIAAHFIATNNYPHVTDRTNGFYRRFFVVEFNHKFSKETADRDLTDKLKAEIAGIVNWALVGVKRLHANSGYTDCVSSAEAIEEWRGQVAPERTFMKEQTKKGSAGMAFLTLYHHYKGWMEGQEDARALLGPRKFSSAVKAMGYEAKRVGGGMVWANLMLGSDPMAVTQ